MGPTAFLIVVRVNDRSRFNRGGRRVDLPHYTARDLRRAEQNEAPERHPRRASPGQVTAQHSNTERSHGQHRERRGSAPEKQALNPIGGGLQRHFTQIR